MKVTVQKDPWMEAMRRGDFESAWKRTDELEATRRQLGRGENNIIWDGSSPAGRHVLVRCLHGLGDTIQFSRFLPLLSRSAASLTVAVQSSLVSLFQHQQGLGFVRDGRMHWQDLNGVLEMEIMELAYAFRATPATLPVPCLRVPEGGAMNSPLSQALSAKETKIAIFWAASGWGGGRKVPLSLFEPLSDLPLAEFFSFQQGPCEIEAESALLPIRRLSAYTSDIVDLTRALGKMDLVISVDAMAAHLAGSLRVPVCLLLERAANWRWIEGSNDSPWYPEMRVFWEHSGWKNVITQVVQHLEQRGSLLGQFS
jgi:hypothetical protein